MSAVNLGVSRAQLTVSDVQLEVSGAHLAVSRVHLVASPAQLAVSEAHLVVSSAQLAVSRVHLAASRAQLAVSEVHLAGYRVHNAFVTRYLVLVLLLATAATAQEYSTSGGEVTALTKHATNAMSGSFSLGTNLLSTSYGGALVPDRVWFFGSALREKSNLLTSQYGAPAASLRGLDAKTNAQLGDRQSLLAAFNSAGSSATGVTPRLNTSLFDLHYMMNVSPSSFFTVSVTKNGARVQQ